MSSAFHVVQARFSPSPARPSSPAAAVAAAPAGHLEGYIPVAAHLSGKFSSFWTTDVWIYTQSATTVNLWYNPSGHDNTGVQSVVVPLTQPVTYLPDIVGTTFHAAGTKGSVHYVADGMVEIVSKTWTPGPTGGTYGQVADGMPVAMASTPGAGPDGSLRMLVNQAPGFRVNLGLLNVTGNAATVTVEIFTADGQPAPGTSSFTVTLQPYDMQEKDDILAGLAAGIPPGTDRARQRQRRATARSWPTSRRWTTRPTRARTRRRSGLATRRAAGRAVERARACVSGS